jgi:hypothetical protein
MTDEERSDEWWVWFRSVVSESWGRHANGRVCVSRVLSQETATTAWGSRGGAEQASVAYLGVRELAHGLALAGVHERADLCAWRDGWCGKRVVREGTRGKARGGNARNTRDRRVFRVCRREQLERRTRGASVVASRRFLAIESDVGDENARRLRTDDSVRRSIVETASSSAATTASAAEPTASWGRSPETTSAAPESSSRGRSHGYGVGG